MLKPGLISDILKLTIEDESFSNQLFKQMEFLNYGQVEHTRIGMYVYFDYDKGIEKHKLTASQLNDIFGDYNQELTKFELENRQLAILADVSVHFSNGIIECVEIWNKLGDYPTKELLTYNLLRLE